ncbi:hypothetical protein M5X00_28305 [Paenibacillus alvei]|uniref:Uncharacterized protein n=1 Tax=Paenibacillus alvei TaxID=44250 RepID=A0ABT4H650_PAEAL|nr:hypothetical protein [Paenibacillus alvei]EJW14415.1 hypothetical protein PAV_13c00340 [Paenibacillus alvei DSM 29]MCY9708706.1 hypothetical protein [Paenibacillus alvei]MCY9737286.1 hypothetical protein [Paenibacillus alvei]MCY9758132.1 hypothetical protein [Paenibacillus alvei]MCY9764233.1 hypothetical protein [Paenibacillus alvei]
MEEIRKALDKLEKLQDETTGVSTPAALADIAVFLRHDLPDIIALLQQIESEMAAVGAATNSTQ